jgi:hypothetical protein
MPSYSLKLEFDAQTLQTLWEADEKVVLVKSPPASGSSGSGSGVVWVAFAPFENNVVTWEEEYAIYASQTGSLVTTTVTTGFPTASGIAFKFNGTGFQETSSNEFPPTGTYRVFNEAANASSYQFGLVQKVIANGGVETQPINAVVIPENQLADFTPVPAVIAWMQSNVSVGETVPIPPPVQATSPVEEVTMMSRSTEIQFGGAVTSVTYKYDSSAGGFVPVQ